MPTVHLLDYVAGNVRSLANAIEKVGYTIEWIKDPRDIEDAEVGDAPQSNIVLASKHSDLTRSKAAEKCSSIELDIAWRRSFWSLSYAVLPGWISRTGSQAH